MKVDFDMIFRLNSAQNLIAEHYIIEFYIIFHLKAARNLVAERYERDFDLIFRLKADQNLVVEHCEWDFYMIFHFKAAQNLDAKHSERFWHNFPLYCGSKRGCRALWKRMTMNKNWFNIVDLVLDNFTRKKARRL